MTDSCDYYSAVSIVKFVSFPVFVLLTINEGLTRNSAPLGMVMACERGLGYHHITEQYRQLTVDSRTRKRRQHHRVARVLLTMGTTTFHFLTTTLCKLLGYVK